MTRGDYDGTEDWNSASYRDRAESLAELPESLAQTADGDRGRRMLDAAQIRRFVTGGKAILTLVGTSNRYTFKVDRVEPTGQYTQPAYFVSLLTGPDNGSDYQYVGLLRVTDGQITLTRKSRMTPESTPVAAWNWLMFRIWAGRMPTSGEVWHVGRCARCGRVLTVPASIESGFGPECMARMEGGE